MLTLGLFRDRRAAVGAVATAGVLVALEISDGLAPTNPGDDGRDQGTINLFGIAMAAAIIGSCVSLVQRRPLPRQPGAWWTGRGSRRP